MRVKLNRQYWTLTTRRDRDDPGLFGLLVEEDKEIWFNPNMPMNDRLPTIVHECFHALFPWMDEDAVIRASNELSTVLKRLGVEAINLPTKEPR